MRVALLSGGKDSFYAAYRVGGVDVGLMLVYRFPRPSPHLVNLGKSVETLLSSGYKILVASLTRGREREETVKLLATLGATEIVAGDVYVEDHLKYMESLAGEVGAKLLEPLWGRDPVDLFYEELESGLELLVIGAEKEVAAWLGSVVTRDNADDFVEDLKRRNMDPLGERGEYHTLVLHSPLHRSRVSYRILERIVLEDYEIVKVV